MEKKGIFQAIVGLTKTVGPIIAVEKIYQGMFAHHFNSPKYISFTKSDFPNLKSEKHSFLSHDKKTLIGYIYSQKGLQNKGIFVFSHGYGGGGHHTYLDLINVITKQGYFVFAYDATANDESEGEDIRGFTQGMLDADSAISYVESLKKFDKYPLYLFGHSWGAYSASNALEFHPRVKGLIALSGFNEATSIFEANGALAGNPGLDFYEHIRNHEIELFGKMATHTAIESFSKSKAKIFLAHSLNDTTVPITAGYYIYEKEFKGNKRFKFVQFLNKGHGTIYDTYEGMKYIDEINKSYNAFKKEKDRTSKECEAYLKKIIDRKKYTNMVDVKFIKEAIRFIK